MLQMNSAYGNVSKGAAMIVSLCLEYKHLCCCLWIGLSRSLLMHSDRVEMTDLFIQVSIAVLLLFFKYLFFPNFFKC